MRLTLPYPPSSNRYWRMWRGRMIKSAEARSYQNTVAILARKAGARPLAGLWCVSLDVFRPRRRGDLDNCIKVLLDSLNGIAWLDDEDVVQIHATRSDDKSNPRVEVFICQFRLLVENAKEGHQPTI